MKQFFDYSHMKSIHFDLLNPNMSSIFTNHLMFFISYLHLDIVYKLTVNIYKIFKSELLE